MRHNLKETEYIKNNLPLLRKDFIRYCFCNVKIKTKQGTVSRLVLNKLQKKLFEIVMSVLLKGEPLRLYLIKSRQTGSTTFWVSFFYWLTSLNSEKNLLLIAHDDEGSEGLQEKFQNLFLRSNPILKPKIRNMNRKETYFATPLAEYARTGDIGLDCHIDSVTASRKSIGRSYTYNYALITEFGLFEENGVDIKAMLGSLYQAVPEEAGTAIVIETTAKGEGYAKEYYENEENGFIKIFISWIADDTYSLKLPRTGEYFDLSETEDSVYGNEFDIYTEIENQLKLWDSGKSSNDLKNNPKELHHQTMCRIAWRRRTINKKCQGDKQVFRQEYPLTVQDAFSTSAKNVFSSRYTDQLLRQIKENPILPQRFTYVHDPRIEEKEKKFMKTLYGELKVYSAPISGKTYVVGGDGAQGIEGGDPSSLVVVQLPEIVVVAILEQCIAPTQFAGAAYWLSKIYNNALIGIELNDKGGYAAIQELEDNYRDANLYYEDVVRITKGQQQRAGWVTNAISRSVMISDTNYYLTNNQLRVYDKDLIDQMRSFVKHPNGKLAAAIGKHDDLIMSLMIGLQIAKSVHIYKPTEKPRVPPRNSPEGIIRRLQRERYQGLRI